VCVSWSGVLHLETRHSMKMNETRNTCSRIHPSLLPFVEQCLANDKLNTQGGVLEVMKPRARWVHYKVVEERGMGLLKKLDLQIPCRLCALFSVATHCTRKLSRFWDR